MRCMNKACERRRRLDSTGVNLRVPVRGALVALNVKSVQRQHTYRPWQIEEDALILHRHVQRESMNGLLRPVRSAVLTPVPMPKRTASSTRNRIVLLRTQLPPLISALPASITNSEGVPLPLQYDSWTPISFCTSSCTAGWARRSIRWTARMVSQSKTDRTAKKYNNLTEKHPRVKALVKELKEPSDNDEARAFADAARLLASGRSRR